mgnify:CR=1 FL=1
MEWSDIRLFLAIAREGTLGGAARTVGLTQPTMGRRLKTLEDAIGHRLFQRTADGFVLTHEGHIMLGHAERMEDEALAFQRELTGDDGGLTGLLRISCSDWFGLHILAPILAAFARQHPNVEVEILTEARLADLTRREADLVFRITPFTEPDVVSRKLMHIPYGLYVPEAAGDPSPGNGEGWHVITMDEAFGGMPDAVWMVQRFPNARIAMRSNNRDVQAALCADGVGMAVLPRPLGDKTAGLRLVELAEAPPGRDTWLGYHRDLRRLARLRAFLDLILEAPQTRQV